MSVRYMSASFIQHVLTVHQSDSDYEIIVYPPAAHSFSNQTLVFVQQYPKVTEQLDIRHLKSRPMNRM